MSKSLSRQGLDWLLANFPSAEVIAITNQGQVIGQMMVASHGAGLMRPEHGPWTCVDFDCGRYAIWNRTGAVYSMDSQGAVHDDPMWEPYEGAARS